jgi:hypothetical protein
MCGAETGFSCADGGMLLFGFMEEETLTGLITVQYLVRKGKKMRGRFNDRSPCSLVSVRRKEERNDMRGPQSASAWVRGVGPRSRPGEMGREKGSAGPTVFCPFFFSFFLFSYFFSSIFPTQVQISRFKKI